jgi:hypothetical protein
MMKLSAGVCAPSECFLRCFRTFVSQGGISRRSSTEQPPISTMMSQIFRMSEDHPGSFALVVVLEYYEAAFYQ